MPWDRFPPFRPAARAIFLHELPRRGHCIDWLIQADEACPGTDTRAIDNGIAYIGATDPGRSPFNRLHKHFLNFWHSCRMFPLVRNKRYDLIQAKDNFSAALVALIVAKVNRIPFFYWVAYPRAEASLYEGRAGVARYPLLYRIRGHVLRVLLYKIILPAADHVFVQSEQMKKDMMTEGVPEATMTAIPSSVDLAQVPYDKSGGGALNKGSSRWVIYLGTLKRIRNLDFIIRSFARVLASVPNAVLLLIGKGDNDSDLQALRDESARLGIEPSVIFTGFVQMSEAWEYVRQADVCLSPYFPTRILQSTSPTKLIEYMAMGKPVVANDHPEQRLVIEESGAGLCVPWTEKEFADAIVEILKNPAGAEAMGRRGRRYVEQHRTNQAMTDTVEGIYHKYAKPVESS